ncbi:MAG: ParB/RepB/Spo0J family partition protein [Deltaproteobacteria bacterium]|nr:ParB/RepB/Spo0J family partition protein [Deltaproteobacteria bacterium]
MPPKNTLGRGLGAMFPDLLEDEGNKPAFIMCGIEELFPNRYQPRKDFNDADQRQLVESIKKSGIIQPIVVRKAGKGYEIIAGERRWRAAQQAGIRDVPVVVREAEDMDVAQLSLVENIQRESLNPIEEANAYQTLTEKFGRSQEEISAIVGKDRSTITNTIRLLKLPTEAKQAIMDKTITAGHARSLLALNSSAEQLKLLEMIIKRGLSVRETEKAVVNFKKGKEDQKAPKKDSYIMDLEKTLSSRLMTKITINHSRNSGSLNIKYKGNEELGRLVNILLNGTRD